MLSPSIHNTRKSLELFTTVFWINLKNLLDLRRKSEKFQTCIRWGCNFSYRVEDNFFFKCNLDFLQNSQIHFLGSFWLDVVPTFKISFISHCSLVNPLRSIIEPHWNGANTCFQPRKQVSTWWPKTWICPLPSLQINKYSNTLHANSSHLAAGCIIHYPTCTFNSAHLTYNLIKMTTANHN